MRQSYTILGLLLVVFCCTQEETNHHFQIVKVGFRPEENIPDSVVSRIDYIPLETNDENLIGEVDKLIIRDGRIYILDESKTQSLFVFDTTGKYLFKINRVGKGPGEYTELNDFDVFENHIALLAFTSVLLFDLEGNYLSTAGFDWIASNISIKSAEEVYLFLNYHMQRGELYPFHIVKTDLQFQSVQEYYPSHYKEVNPYVRFQLYGNSLLMAGPTHEGYSIYDVTTEDYFPYVTYDFQRFNIPDEILENKYSYDDFKEYAKLSFSLVSDELMYFNFAYQRYVYMGLFLRKTNKVYTGKTIENVPIRIPLMMQIEGHKLYAICEPFIAIDQYNYWKDEIDFNPRFNSDILSELINTHTLTENSNPMIVCYTIDQNSR